MACTGEEDHDGEEMEAQHVVEMPLRERPVVEDDEEAALLTIMRRYRKNWEEGMSPFYGPLDVASIRI
jgi:hypothetical protein